MKFEKLTIYKTYEKILLFFIIILLSFNFFGFFIFQKIQEKIIINIIVEYKANESITNSAKKINTIILHAHYIYTDKSNLAYNQDRYNDDYKKLINYLDNFHTNNNDYNNTIKNISFRVKQLHLNQINEKKEFSSEEMHIAKDLGDFSKKIEEKNNYIYIYNFSKKIEYIMFIISNLLLVFVFIFINKIYNRFLINPVKYLSKKIINISKSNFSSTINFSNRCDEIGQLSKSIDIIEYKIQKLGIDHLTNIKNRMFFFEETIKNKNFYIINIDIDNFKKINDKYGHEIGDNVLVCIFNICKFFYPISSYRFGGDELIIISSDNIQLSLYKLYAIFLLIQKFSEINSLNVSISVGIIFCPRAADLNKYLNESDSLMYESKKHNGNYYTLSSCNLD